MAPRNTHIIYRKGGEGCSIEGNFIRRKTALPTLQRRAIDYCIVLPSAIMFHQPKYCSE